METKFKRLKVVRGEIKKNCNFMTQACFRLFF
jgi:hypothetical protein